MNENKNYRVTLGYGDEWWDEGWDEYFFDTLEECRNFIIEKDGYIEYYAEGCTENAELYNYGMVEIKKMISE